MITNLYCVRLAHSDDDFARLQEFFTALGLPFGTEWRGTHNRGAIYRAPMAGVEVGSGPDFPDAPLLVEVANADETYARLRGHGFAIVDDIADRRWGARMFVIEPAEGNRVAIFSYLPEHAPQQPRVWEGKLEARGRRFGIVVSRFNSFIAERLLQGAVDALRRCGAADRDIEVVRVPGAFEIPSAANALAASKRVDAVICIGCIIRGETTHYEHIAEEVTRGIGQSSVATGVPHSYGVLTCENLEQAIDRAGLKSGNKGFEAAMAAIEMANLNSAVREAK